MLSPFGELKDCVVIVDKMSQKSRVRCQCCLCRRAAAHAVPARAARAAAAAAAHGCLLSTGRARAVR
jgi:hypothetical protein